MVMLSDGCATIHCHPMFYVLYWPAVLQDEDDDGEDGVKSLEDDEKDDDEVQVNVHDHSMSLLEEGACLQK